MIKCKTGTSSARSLRNFIIFRPLFAAQRGLFRRQKQAHKRKPTDLLLYQRQNTSKATVIYKTNIQLVLSSGFNPERYISCDKTHKKRGKLFVQRHFCWPTKLKPTSENTCTGEAFGHEVFTQVLIGVACLKCFSESTTLNSLIPFKCLLTYYNNFVCQVKMGFRQLKLPMHFDLKQPC